jgi:hypothetical protein
VLLTSYWQPFIEVPEPLYHIEELGPDLFPAPRLEERFAVAYDDQAPASAGEKHIQSLRRGHEADVTLLVASSERCDDNLILFALIVVYVY